ncbi:protein MAIN-LIKE 2-like [Triticum urartu]|nr:protein MAIN-LIKE 2-like [Triticum urartu]
MSNKEELLVQESTTAIIPSTNRSPPTTRLARFLLPRADGARLPALPSPSRNGGPVLGEELRVEWRGWPGSSKLWRRWVAKLRPQHEGLWRRVGIFDAILATTRQVRRDEGLLLQLMAFWSKETSTFVFPWGEATVTLEDMAVLGGLPLLGKPVSAELPDALCGEVAALKATRSAVNRSKSRKAKYSIWAKYFLDRPREDDVAGGRSGEDAAGRLLEHGAFLAMWLSAYVLPSRPFDVVQARVFPIAAQLARGQSVALAPAALAGIYSCLSTLAGCAPLQILQLWVWEYFPELRPEKQVSPDNNDDGVPARAAQWHDVAKAFNPIYIHAVFMSPEKFEWMPYGSSSSSSFGLPPGNGGRTVHGQDIARSDKLLSMALCLRPCELVGIDCIEQYCPHRVARQLGFDQEFRTCRGTSAVSTQIPGPRGRRMRWRPELLRPSLRKVTRA